MTDAQIIENPNTNQQDGNDGIIRVFLFGMCVDFGRVLQWSMRRWPVLNIVHAESVIMSSESLLRSLALSVDRLHSEFAGRFHQCRGWNEGGNNKKPEMKK